MSTTRRYWPRYLGALALIVVLASSATAFAALRTLDCLVKVCDDGTFEGEPSPEPDLEIDEGVLAKAQPGEPQTLLLIGSDGRSKKSADGASEGGARSDTMMLLHLDAKRGGAVLSIPRDTQVTLPSGRTTKINEAYTEGGAELTIKVVRDLLGIKVNEAVEINFEAFQRSVNRLECLYQDIDRSYFNDNSTGTNYATIDVKSGYQLLCGGQTLDWVRFRHTDNDLVRGARQQEFIRSAKSQVAVNDLLGAGNDLVKIFRHYTRTTITDSSDLITLMKLAVDASSHQLQSVRFRTYEQPGTTNLLVNDRDVGIMRREFERLEGSSGQTTSPSAKTQGKTPKKATRKSGALAAGLVRVPSETEKAELVNASFKLAAGKLPVYYPSIRVAVGGYAQRDPVRAYSIKAGRFTKKTYPAFRLTYSLGEGKYFGQYYGIQGTTWKDPPLLQADHTTVNRRGRTLRVYKAGSRTKLVSWTTDDGAYWVSNSLSLSLTNSQMLDIASSFTRVAG